MAPACSLSLPGTCHPLQLDTGVTGGALCPLSGSQAHPRGLWWRSQAIPLMSLSLPTALKTVNGRRRT